MKIEAFKQCWDAQDEASIARALQTRDARGGGAFWLSPDGELFPALAIRVTQDFADAHYFPTEGHPGYRALSDHHAPQNEVRFAFEGCDPGDGEVIASEFIIPASHAIELAILFFQTETRPATARWLEL